jgi:hypothetical protein
MQVAFEQKPIFVILQKVGIEMDLGRLISQLIEVSQI